MKRIITTLCALVLVASAANAQSGLLGALKNLGSAALSSAATSGNTSSSSDATAAGNVVSALSNLSGSAAGSVLNALLGQTVATTTDLKGSWTYNGVATGMTTGSTLGNIAASAAMGTVESKIDELLAKVGITAGNATFVFGDDYKFTLTAGKLNLTGTWEQTSTGVTIKFGKVLTYLQLDGKVTPTTDGCQVLCDATKFLTFTQKLLGVVGKIVPNNTLSAITTLLDKAEGVQVGFKLKK